MEQIITVAGKTGITWLDIVLAVAGFLISAIPLTIALVSAHRARKMAKTDAEVEKSKADMKEYAMVLMIGAEKLYSNVNNILKQTGDTAGELKKDSVMSKLQSYAFEKGYNFDKEYWSQEIDTTISATKQINS